MREILFRGKDAETGKWIYGWVFGNKAKSIIEIDTEYVIEEGVEAYYTSVVIPETVGQYTGLKDKKGKDIFEGDIHEYDGRHFAVKFGYYTDDDTHIEMYGWYLDSNSLEEQVSLGVDSEKYVNIIGNITDNPELLND